LFDLMDTYIRDANARRAYASWKMALWIQNRR
jgi:hypothetical protein